MLIIAHVLKEKWLKITGFSHSQTTNKVVNKAANDSARVSGQDRKNPPALGTNQITGFGGFRPLASLKKNKMAYYICGQYFGFNISLIHSQSYMEVHIAPYQTCSLNPPRALTRTRLEKNGEKRQMIFLRALACAYARQLLQQKKKILPGYCDPPLPAKRPPRHTVYQ